MALTQVSQGMTQNVFNGSNRNLVKFADFENQLTQGWALGTIGTLTNGLPTGTPNFGGVTSNLTMAISTASPIDGTAHLQLTASGVTTAGNMVASIPIAIPPAFRTKVLSIAHLYSVLSGAASLNLSGTLANSFAMAVWDVTNSAFIPTTGAFNYTQNNAVPTATSSIQVPFNCASVRLCFYFPTASTGAFSLGLKNFYLGAQSLVTGPVVSDLAPSFTNNGQTILGATTTAPTKGFPVLVDKLRVGRVGDHARIKLEYGHNAGATVGTNGSGDYLFTLPNSLLFDSNKTTFFTGNVGSNGAGIFSPSGLGTATVTQYTSGTSNYSGVGTVVPYDATRFRIFVIDVSAQGTAAASGTGFISSGFFSFGGAGLQINADFDAPILGWSGNQVQSSDSAGQAAIYAANSNTFSAVTGSSNVPITGFTARIDTQGTGTTNGVTIAMTGTYQLIVGVGTNASNGPGKYIDFRINGTATGKAAGGGGTSYSQLTNSQVLNLNAGDTVGLAYISTSGTTENWTVNTFTVTKISNPATISQSDPVNCRYSNTSGTAVTTTASNIPYPTKIYDTHGAFNPSTGFFTAPFPGKYAIKCYMRLVNTAFVAGSALQITLSKNGTYNSDLATFFASASVSTSWATNGSDTIFLLAGETINVQGYSSVNSTLLPNGGTNYIAIEKVG